MHRYIHGGNVHFDYAVDVLVGHIGKGHVVSVEKREARIVILEVKSLAHSLRKLIDKAKDTFVVTGVLLVHKGRFKIKPDVVVLPLTDDRVVDLPVSLDNYVEMRIGKVKSIVEHVLSHFRLL
jgi:hypothetical protein